MRSPITVCWRVRATSPASRAAGFSRIASGPAHDGAGGWRHGEALALLGERGHRRVDVVGEHRAAGMQEHAELVAAEAVGRAASDYALLEGGAQPGEQRVAGRVAEGVVVPLESVEVEQNEHVRLAARKGLLDIDH